MITTTSPNGVYGGQAPKVVYFKTVLDPTTFVHKPDVVPLVPCREQVTDFNAKRDSAKENMPIKEAEVFFRRHGSCYYAYYEFAYSIGKYFVYRYH